MSAGNAKQNKELSSDNISSLEQLEKDLSDSLFNQVSDLEELEENRLNIGTPDKLGQVVSDTVWEQLLNNIASVAGEDFIEQNNDKTLDLRKKAHIQDTDDFAKGKIATHNSRINYQERYDKWQENFQKDQAGNIVYHTDRTGKQKENLVKNARKPYDKGRPLGSKKRKTDMDHDVSAAEIMRDPEANAHLTMKERIDFANSSSNLNEIDSSQNRSKGDLSMEDWLETPNAHGQKPEDIFNDLNEEQKEKYYEKDAEARESYKKNKEEGKKRSIETGRQSQKEEAFRIGGKALRSMAMQFLSEFIKEVVHKFIHWLKSANKTLKTLLSHIKLAVRNFVDNLGNYLLNSGKSMITTIATSIFGPIVRTVTKVFEMLKQGLKSVKEAVSYINKPENRQKPLAVLIAEVGKIIVAGISAVGALSLGDLVEKGLMSIPPFAIEIPLFGSLASILGLVIGSLISALLGAIILNLIDKLIAKKLKSDATKNIIKEKNEILHVQDRQGIVSEKLLSAKKQGVQDTIKRNHQYAEKELKNMLTDISNDNVIQQEDRNISENQNDFDEMQKELNDLL